MARLWYGTVYVAEDEPCLGLTEGHWQSPGSKGFHRYQRIFVMRDDKPALYEKDMGDARWFKNIDPISIPGGAYDEVDDKYYVEHSVGELVEIANQIRGSEPLDKRELAEVDRIRT